MTISQARNSAIRSQVKLAEGEGAYTTSVSKKSEDLEGFKTKMEDAKAMVIKTMILTSKYQSISGEGGGASNMSSQMLEATSTIANFSMQEMEMEQSLKNMELQKQASFATTSQMVGQRVSIEDGSRSFSGKSGELVKFQYNILGKDIPASALIQTQISLVGKDGKKILSKTENGKHGGQNSFVWDGKDDKGNRAAAGSYDISVSASYTMPGKNDKPIPLTATTVREGTVDEVTRDEDDNISLIVDGQKVDRSSIRGMSRDGKKDIEEAKGPISDYISYIGQKVQVKQEKVNFNNNKTNVPFISKSDAAKAKIEVRFFDSTGSFVAYSQHIQDIKAGQNNFSWNGEDAKSEAALKDMHVNKMLSYVPVGVYRYEVSVTTKNNDGTETTHKLDNNDEFVIDSIDKTNGKIMLASGKYKFDLRDVSKLIEKTPEKARASHIALLQEGTELIGKVVKYKNDIIGYDGATDPEITFDIPNPGVGFTVDSANITIMDDKGVIVATIGKPTAEVYAEDSVPIPVIANSANIDVLFDPASIVKIKNVYIDVFPGKAIQNINPKELKILNQYIAQAFREGKIFAAGYEVLAPLLQEEQKLKNMGIIKAVWNGKGPAPGNQQLPKGDYQVSISYQIKNTATNTLHFQDLALTPSFRVMGTHVEDNEVMLDLQNGHILPTNQVLSVRG